MLSLFPAPYQSVPLLISQSRSRIACFFSLPSCVIREKALRSVKIHYGCKTEITFGDIHIAEFSGKVIDICK